MIQRLDGGKADFKLPGLVGSGRLAVYLPDIDDSAQEWMDRMFPQMAEASDVPE